MTPQEALDILREHLTTLYANPRMLGDETPKVIEALEQQVIPVLEILSIDWASIAVEGLALLDNQERN